MAGPILGSMPLNMCPAHFISTSSGNPPIYSATHPACMHILLSCMCHYSVHLLIHTSASPSIHEDCANSSCLARIQTIHSYYFQSEAGPQIEEQRGARRPEHHIIQLDPDPESTSIHDLPGRSERYICQKMNTSYHLGEIITSCFCRHSVKCIPGVFVVSALIALLICQIVINLCFPCDCYIYQLNNRLNHRIDDHGTLNVEQSPEVEGIECRVHLPGFDLPSALSDAQAILPSISQVKQADEDVFLSHSSGQAYSSFACRLWWLRMVVLTRLDYCNGLLGGASKCLLSPSLSAVLQAAARLILLLLRTSSVADRIPTELHWLDITLIITLRSFRLPFKSFLSLHQVLFVTSRQSTPSLWSDGCVICAEDTHTLTIHSQIFAISSLWAWNCLPVDRRDPGLSDLTFRRRP